MCGVAGAVLFFLFGEFGRRELGAAFKFPALGHRRGIIPVFHIAATFEHEGLEPFFGEFLRGPAATDTRANHDGIVGVLLGACALNISHGERLTCSESDGVN